MNRIKAYQQLEHSDCGITCIRIIARYYGRAIPLGVLREMCDVGRMGISLRDIVGCTRRLGFHAEAVKIRPKDVERMPLPAVLYWDQRHYVVLYRQSKDGSRYWIADPAQGKLKLRRDDFMRHWLSPGGEGLAVVMDPTDQFYALDIPKEKGWGSGLLRMMRRTIADNRMMFVAVTLLTLLGMAADIVSPLLFQRTIDDGINGRDLPLVWLLVLGQFAVFIGSYVSSGISDLLFTKAGLRMSIRMINEYLGKLIRLPISFFDRKVSSDLIQKIDDQNRVKNFLLSMPESLLFTVVNLVVFSSMMIYYSSAVFGIFLASTALSFVWTQLHMRRRKAIDYSYFSYASENRNNVYELVNGMQEIKINNAQQTRVAVWNEVQEKINRLSMRSALLNLSMGSGNTFFSRIKDILITGICATMVVRGEMTIGEMMTINYIAGRLATPFDNLLSLPAQLQDASISYGRLEEIVNRDDAAAQGVGVDTSSGMTLRLEHVGFKYPGSYSPYVINDFSAVFPEGKTTAIVGSSGCGKTTLIKLMLGFYVPQQGSVLVGNTNLADADRDAWLENCGVVAQNGYVFSGTILENIALADAKPDLQRARQAAATACIDDFFSSLPMGYHTRLGNAGLELSGGQRQRLFIARAVYKNPRLLVLDEATSSLDANNEAQIVRNLSEFYRHRTVVIAAHRLSTVRHADNIIYMESGRVVEQGSHEQLVALRGAYFKLVKEQLQMDVNTD